MRCVAVVLALASIWPCAGQEKARKPDGNRLAYLDEVNLYYPHRDFARLTTPQWVAENDVEAVVILAIDDMRDPQKYEAYLRPILRRLQQIDGRAPVSIMTCKVDPKDPQLQAWLKEGLSLECHTVDHPCPFFKKGFDHAKQTYEECIDLMSEIPGNRPVAFRMPCCDSLNTPSPRFYAEIFQRTTPRGNFLSIDSSVFTYYTSADPELPRELVLDADKQERFVRYLPKDRSFVNTIENYPYPYPIGTGCWQFPCMTPSDWQAQHLQKPNNPRTVEDWKAALDCTVIKKGVFTMVFHPHGWIKSDQIVELIDHAVSKHGKKVMFLTFREAQERLDRILLSGSPLRHPNTGGDNGVRLIDLDHRGKMGVLIGNEAHHQGWRWLGPKDWQVCVELRGIGPTSRFGTARANSQWLLFGAPGRAVFAPLDGEEADADRGTANLEELIKQSKSGQVFLEPFLTADAILFRDLDGDGTCELLARKGNEHSVYQLEHKDLAWKKLTFTFPPGAVLADASGKDTGLRFVDLNGDRQLDMIFSNESEFGIYLFGGLGKGWSKLAGGKRSDAGALPMIARNGTNNGFWMHSGHLWWSNEDTVMLKDFVDRRDVRELLAGKK
jgi:peptidoglycan/xylan/chitin deacetylase (PgdA/CDA1 family)